MYTNYVAPEILERARAAGLVDEFGHVTRDICMCDARGWGWVFHARACPVRQYYQAGGLEAERVLRAALAGCSRKEATVRVETYKQICGDIRVVMHVGNRGHSLALGEAFELGRQLIQATSGGAQPEEHGVWYLLSGAQHAQVVGQVTGTIEDAKEEAEELAKRHKAAVWALRVVDVSGILAWPGMWREEDRAGTEEEIVGEVPAVSLESLGDMIEAGLPEDALH